MPPKKAGATGGKSAKGASGGNDDDKGKDKKSGTGSTIKVTIKQFEKFKISQQFIL